MVEDLEKSVIYSQIFLVGLEASKYASRHGHEGSCTSRGPRTGGESGFEEPGGGGAGGRGGGGGAFFRSLKEGFSSFQVSGGPFKDCTWENLTSTNSPTHSFIKRTSCSRSSSLGKCQMGQTRVSVLVFNLANNIRESVFWGQSVILKREGCNCKRYWHSSQKTGFRCGGNSSV